MNAIRIEEFGDSDVLEVGEVEDGVDLEEGYRVVGLVGQGGYAEYAVADAEALFPVPEGLDFEEAAGFPIQYLIAHNCLFEWGRLEAGERVLINAAAGWPPERMRKSSALRAPGKSSISGVTIRSTTPTPAS